MALQEFALPLAGGLLIGAAASGLLLFNGRIAGISGILRGLVTSRGGEFSERLLFLLGLVLGAWLYESWSGQFPVARAHFPIWLLATSGLLVGFGTGIARGCTSGHGVCGLARLSIRSFVAVAVFLFVGFITTYLARHVWGVY